MYNYVSSRIFILLKTIILSACLSGYIISMENAASDDSLPINKITVQFSNEEKITVPLATLQKFQTLAHFLEDYNTATDIQLPEYVTKKNFELLTFLASGIETNNTSHDILTSASSQEIDQEIERALKSLDAQQLIDLLNLADFLAATNPYLFDLLSTHLAKKIMNKKGLVFFCKNGSYYSHLNPEMQFLVINKILKQHVEIRIPILQAYPITSIAIPYDSSDCFYNCHNKTFAFRNTTKNTISIHDISSGALVSTYSFSPYILTKLKYSSDGNRIAITLHNKQNKSWHVTLFDVNTGNKVLTTEESACEITGVIINPDNETMVIEDQKGIRLWNIPNKTPSESIEYNLPANESVPRYNANGILRAITLNGGLLEIQDIKTGNIIHQWDISTLDDREDIKTTLVGNNHIQVIYKNNLIKIYDFAGKSCYSFMAGSYTENLYYNSDSSIIISRSLNGNFSVGDAITGEPVRNYKSLKSNVPSVSPDHNTLITMVDDGFKLSNLKSINNLSQNISLPQIVLLSALVHKVITLTNINQNTYLRTIKDSIPFDVTNIALWSPSNYFNKLKSIFS